MNHLKRIFKQNFPDAKRIDVLIWFAIAAIGTLVGLLITVLSFRESLDFGDGSTFFQFAHNLAHGEVIYKDFIHFRTPGSYFLQAMFINIFGDQQSSVRFALGVESHVLYGLLFTIALAVFLRFKHAQLGLVAAVSILALPAYAQLRTVLALLAVVLYVQSYRTKKGRSVWLFFSGLFVGLAFIFGQEAALIAVIAIGLTEVFQGWSRNIKITLKQIAILVAGLLTGAAPLLLYVLFLSDIPNFIYYTLYYAFILQPQGMDLVYPAFQYSNIIYYLVFALYLVVFYIFYSSRKLGVTEGAVLIFGILRLVTLLGRSDMGHLIFVLPEVLFLTIFAIASLKSAVFDRDSFMRFVPYGIGLFGTFYLAIHFNGMYIVASALIVIISLRFRHTPDARTGAIDRATLTILFIITSLFAVLLYIIYPYFMSTVDGLSRRGLTDMQLGGVNVTKPVYDEVNAVEKAVGVFNPTTIFSYPIQPYYYSLAPKHAARFITFEPQTTESEQNDTIEDLEHTQPEVIIYDPVQAISMSGSLYKINNYILDNYKTVTVVDGTRTLWIMTPKNQGN